MADPLSVTASLIAIIGLGGKIIDTCCKIRGAPKEAEAISEELSSLLPFLTQLRRISEEIDSKSSEAVKLSGLKELFDENGPLQICESRLEALERRMQSMFRQDEVPASDVSRLARRHASTLEAMYKRVKWPCQVAETREVLESIRSLRNTVQLALQIHQAGALDGLFNKVEALGDELAKLTRRTVDQQIHDWLNPPDASIHYQQALEKRQIGTGTWLTERNAEYTKWKEKANHQLWLYGIPGCGKSVLSATVIEDVSGLCARSGGRHAVVYFYFGFKDTARRTVDQLLRSMIFQLATQSLRVSNALDEMHEQCGSGKGRVSYKNLLTTFRKLLDDFIHKYVIIDALDECSEEQKLLDFMVEVGRWKPCNLHILLLSRQNSTIEADLKASSYEAIALTASIIADDIKLHVQAQLGRNPKIRALVQNNDEAQQMIMSKIAQGAEGMFKWVECQLDAISKCKRPKDLISTLNSLPQSLDQTYERILQSVDEDDIEDVIKVLQWLCYTARPLNVAEIADALAVDLTQRIPVVSDQHRLFDPFFVVSVCSSLVSTSIATSGPDPTLPLANRTMLTLAHFTVEEYLLSGRCSFRAFDKAEANAMITSSCIGYLLHAIRLEDASYVDSSASHFQAHRDYLYHWLHSNRMRYTLGNYAQTFWMEHYIAAADIAVADIASNDSPQANSTAMSRADAAYALLTHPWYRERLSAMYDGRLPSSPLAACVRLGLIDVCRKFMSEGNIVDDGEITTGFREAIRCRQIEVIRLFVMQRRSLAAQLLLWACLENSLHAASYLLNEATDPKRPTDSTAHLNAPLRVAAMWDNVDIVSLLVRHGVDINARWSLHNALEYASIHNSAKTTELLLLLGAEVNTATDGHSCALQIAYDNKHKKIFKLLLDRGAELTVPCYRCWMQLRSAVPRRKSNHRRSSSDLRLDYEAVKSIFT